MSTGVIVLIVVAVVLVLGVIFIYNNLVSLRNNRENAFANIDVQLKQRHDLIPQLVAAVKGYAEHEKGLLERITQARTAAMNATTINDKIEAENALSRASPPCCWPACSVSIASPCSKCRRWSVPSMNRLPR